MNPDADAEVIRAVREMRTTISIEFGNYARRLVDHYQEQQRQHRDRVLDCMTAPQQPDPSAAD